MQLNWSFSELKAAGLNFSNDILIYRFAIKGFVCRCFGS